MPPARAVSVSATCICSSPGCSSSPRARHRLRRGRPRVATVTTVTGAGSRLGRGGRRRRRWGPARDRSRMPSHTGGRGARPGLGRNRATAAQALAALARAAARARGRGGRSLLASLRPRGHVPHEAHHGLGHGVMRILGCRRVHFTRCQPRIRLLRRGPAPGISQPAVPLVCDLPKPPQRLLVWVARHAWHAPNELDLVQGRARRKGRSRPQPDGRGGRGRLNPHAGVGGRSRVRVSWAGRRSGHVAGGRSRAVVLTGLIYMYLNIS